MGFRPTLPASEGTRFASASHGRISTCLLCRFHLVDTLCEQILRRRSPDRGLFASTIIILSGEGIVKGMEKNFSPFSDFCALCFGGLGCVRAVRARGLWNVHAFGCARLCSLPKIRAHGKNS